MDAGSAELRVLNPQIRSMHGGVFFDAQLFASLKLALGACIHRFHADIEYDGRFQVARRIFPRYTAYSQCPIPGAGTFRVLDELGGDIDLILYVFDGLYAAFARVVSGPAVFRHACANVYFMPQLYMASASSNHSDFVHVLLSMSSNFPHINPAMRLSGSLGRMPIYKFGR
tara:strand:- start:565 stop:1077 length:513 start_codon:yes stop_codon:yes gene_type:complete